MVTLAIKNERIRRTRSLVLLGHWLLRWCGFTEVTEMKISRHDTNHAKRTVPITLGWSSDDGAGNELVARIIDS